MCGKDCKCGNGPKNLETMKMFLENATVTGNAELHRIREIYKLLVFGWRGNPAVFLYGCSLKTIKNEINDLYNRDVIFELLKNPKSPLKNLIKPYNVTLFDISKTLDYAIEHDLIKIVKTEVGQRRSHIIFKHERKHLLGPDSISKDIQGRFGIDIYNFSRI